MLPHQTPFPTAWLSIELGDYRPESEPSTYSFFAYEDLPPLSESELGQDFAWLKEGPLYGAGYGTIDLASQIERLLIAATQKQLTLPAEFVHLMQSPDLPNRIRSCTDCFFKLSNEIVASPAREGGYLIHFLSDSQGCLFWYLYLTPTGEHCIVVSGELFDTEGLLSDEDDEDIEDSVDSYTEGSIGFCAPSFAEFIYRYWIENEIWFALFLDDTPLTQRQKDYVAHYQK